MSDNISQKLVHIPAGTVVLEGFLSLPEGAMSIVVFAHGSGSSRHSRRNKFVADKLLEAGIGTLLFDLLTEEEDTVYETRFDISLLADRLKDTTRWVISEKQTGNLNIGYFGASTGAAAAIKAAADIGTVIGAIVSRGGRPDLAEQALGRIKSPILLIVGGYDDVVIELNRQAYRLIKAEKEMKIIPGATHLFEETGALEKVALLAAEWFKLHLLIEKVKP
ncbi:MAG: dienelactone hydrolase family protein [Nitrospirae bacterium]|nr:dienelactone hydrolase family protein [Nitrospirota bacterium]